MGRSRRRRESSRRRITPGRRCRSSSTNVTGERLTPEVRDPPPGYYGASVKDPVLVYRGGTWISFPLWTGGISVWRHETLIVRTASRSQVSVTGRPPLGDNTTGTDKKRTADVKESIPRGRPRARGSLIVKGGRKADSAIQDPL